jgi:hypothetical protein
MGWLVYDNCCITIHSSFDADKYRYMRHIICGDELPIIKHLLNAERAMECAFSYYINSQMFIVLPQNSSFAWIGKVPPIRINNPDRAEEFISKVCEFNDALVNIPISEYSAIKKLCDEVGLPIYKYLYVDNNNLHKFIGDIYMRSRSVAHAQGIVARLMSIRGCPN